MGDDPVPVVIWLEERAEGVETALGAVGRASGTVRAADEAALERTSAWPQISQ